MKLFGPDSSFAERARTLDASDQLAAFRQEFVFPLHNGEPCVYLTGNSLGLMPKAARAAISEVLDEWGRLGVEGHMQGRIPWFRYHEDLSPMLATLVGALPHEVVAMNSLTVNLHLMLASFYRPEGRRRKVLLLPAEFPSDRYAVESQVRWHGLDRSDCIVEPAVDAAMPVLSTETITDEIQRLGDELALVHMSAVHYLTGQVLDVAAISAAAHHVGALVGWDLAHAIGNIPLQLHQWDVDYAVWCSYKYLNSGPGGVGGVFVHERHVQDRSLLRLAGWWGNDPERRFSMPQWFEPVPTAESWQLSNAPVLAMAVHRVALEQFQRAGIERLRQKSVHLTGFLESVLDCCAAAYPELGIQIVTPRQPSQRGAQLSVRCRWNGRDLYDHLIASGVVVDWRTPDIIRMAPAPLYCSFADVLRVGEAIEEFAISHGAHHALASSP